MGILSGLTKFASKALGVAGGPVGQLVGGGLELASGLKSAFGRGPKTYSPSEQAYGQLMGAFKAADKAGLHRLTVAGSPSGYSPVPQNESQGLLQAGQALRSMGDRKKENELIDAQIEEARSRTILNTANAKRAMSGPQPGLGGPTVGIKDALDRAPDGSRRGVRVEPEPQLPARQKVTFGEHTSVGPNPEAFEIGLSELIAGILMHGPQWLYSGLGGGSLNSNRSGRDLSVPKPKRPGATPNQPGYRP